MKHLIIYAHPNPESLNNQLKSSLLRYLQENSNEVVVRDLYQLQFDPILTLEDMAGQRIGEVSQDVKTEQDHITWADCIIFIHPIWWTGLPAIMKGYIDRVFSYGFAYRYDKGEQKGLLTGKKALIINTHGKSNAEYKSIKMDKALSLTSDTGIYSYCGLDIVNHFFFDQADKATAENIAVWETEIISTFKANLIKESCDLIPKKSDSRLR